MPAQWTAEVIGQMHLNGITQTDIAKHLGLTRAYINMVLKGHREPPDGEKKIRKALAELIEKKGD